jgi:hypothetical protein
VATLRPALATPPRRTDVHRLADMLVSARVVADRVDGSEVDDALGANIVTAGESDRREKWEDVSFPAIPAGSSPARWLY